jgi:dihydroorotase (multifunctional complex type)
MSFDLLITNGVLATSNGKVKADVGVKDGTIVAIGAVEPAAANCIDAEGMLVLPGIIDMHVHFRDPGAVHKEDFEHGSAAAACGGVTLICDMPNTTPPVITADRFRQKLSHVEGRSYVDYGFWAGGLNVEEFSTFKALGAVGLKVYMNRPLPGSQSYSDKLSMPDDATFVRVLRAAAQLDWPVSVHVANSSLDEAYRATFIAKGMNHARHVCLMTRSAESTEAQARLIHYAKVTGARVHIAHISFNAMEALDDFRHARQSGSHVTAEVVPPCLSFNDLDRVGPFGIPFAHPSEQNDEYWAALREGLIDVIATDHAPHTRDEKLKGANCAWNAPSGYPAVETLLPLLIDAVLQGRLSYERLVQVAAENPARLLGLSRKGSIEIGKDADFAIVDPNTEWRVDEASLHSKSGWSPFNGRLLKGRVRRTLLRGVEIARDGELVSRAPFGRAVNPTRVLKGESSSEPLSQATSRRQGLQRVSILEGERK